MAHAFTLLLGVLLLAVQQWFSGKFLKNEINERLNHSVLLDDQNKITMGFERHKGATVCALPIAHVRGPPPKASVMKLPYPHSKAVQY